MTKLYIGIDPGKTGAIAIIDDKLKVIDVYDMPVMGEEYDYNSIIEDLENYPEATILIEKCKYTPAIRGKGAFTFGLGIGSLYGILAGLKRPYERVEPLKWKKEFTLINKPKTESVAKAKQLFPKLPSSTFVTPKGRILDGRAEALLLAEYARRKL